MNSGFQGDRWHDPGSRAPVPVPVYLRILTALLVGVVLLLLVRGLAGSNLFLVLVALALPVALLLIHHSRPWFLLTIGLFYSDLYIPGFPRSFDLYHASAIGLVPLLVATTLLAPQRTGYSRLLKIMAAGFLVIMAITIQQRGFGLAALGGSMWGGANYVYMGLAFTMFFFSDSLVLQPRQWRRLLVFLFVLGCLPALAEAAFLLSRGHVVLPFLFIRRGSGAGEYNLDALLGYHETVFRFMTMKKAVLLTILALALWPYSGKYKKRIWAVGALSTFLVGLSGHRTELFVLGFTSVLGISLTRRRPAILMATAFVGALLVATLVLALWGRTLPLPIQRTVAWVPFADISPLARESAMTTLEGRVKMWQTLVTDYLPQYWLLGRGFAFSVGELVVAHRAWHPKILTFMTTSSYHNGPLVLLINLGIGGIAFGYGFLLAGLWRHVRLLRRAWASDSLARLHRIMFSFYCATLITQTATGCGDWITEPIIIMTILEGLWQTNCHTMNTDNLDSSSTVSELRVTGKEPA